MERIARHLSEYVVRYTKHDEWKDVYVYSFQVLLESIVSFVWNFAIAILIGMPAEFLLAMVLFIYGRMHVGGLHLATYGRCFILTGIVNIGILFATRYTHPGMFLCLVAMLAVTVVILIISPVEDRNKPIDTKSRKIIRKKVVILLIAANALFVCCLLCRWDEWFRLITNTMIVVAASGLIGLLKNRWRNC